MRRGFTLVEVLVALVLSSVVLMIAHRTWAVTIDTARALASHQAHLEHRATVRRWLEEILGSLDAGVPGDTPFKGTQVSLAATGSVVGPEGWAERLSLSVRLEGETLWCVTTRGRLRLGGIAWWQLEYLVGEGQNARWFPEWESEVTLPRAVRVYLGHVAGTPAVDTILVVPGRRG